MLVQDELEEMNKKDEVEQEDHQEILGGSRSRSETRDGYSRGTPTRFTKKSKKEELK